MGPRIESLSLLAISLSLVAVAAQSTRVEEMVFPLWSNNVAFPSSSEMQFLRAVTHVSIERATPAGFHYLHEAGIAVHKGVFHAVFANGPWERDYSDELVRESTSKDGLSWSKPVILAPGGPDIAHNHPVIVSTGDQLWVFVTRFEARIPSLEGFRWVESTGAYESIGILVKDFMAFDPPKKMKDGNWILAGEKSFAGPARVLISRGDDLTKWEPVDIEMPAGQFRGPDTTVLVGADSLIAVSRNNTYNVALASESKDCGRTWSRLRTSNFPMGASKPIGGVLSNGQSYLISNNAEQGRSLLSIAVSKPGEREFSAIWKIRHAATPRRRSPVQRAVPDPSAQWTYPAAVEYRNHLYVIYDLNKEDCELSIIPLSALAID